MVFVACWVCGKDIKWVSECLWRCLHFITSPLVLQNDLQIHTIRHVFWGFLLYFHIFSRMKFWKKKYFLNSEDEKNSNELLPIVEFPVFSNKLLSIFVRHSLEKKISCFFCNIHISISPHNMLIYKIANTYALV